MLIQPLNLIKVPFLVLEPLIVLKEGEGLDENFLLLNSSLSVGSVDDFGKIGVLGFNGLDILHDEFVTNDAEVDDGVDFELCMDDALVLEGSHDVEDSVDSLDVTEESISESSSLVGTSDEAGNVPDAQEGGDLALGLVDLAKLIETVVRDGNSGLMGLLGAEGEVLCGDIHI